MKTWITLGIFIIWCDEIRSVHSSTNPGVPYPRNHQSNSGQSQTPPGTLPGILEANGQEYWTISNVSPVFSTKCLSTSTNVFVTYSCRDAYRRREMCEDLTFSTSGVVDLATPGYPYPLEVGPYMVACRCKASIGEYGGIRLTLLDLNFTQSDGSCGGHYFSNSSVVEWSRLSDGHGGDQNYGCSQDIHTPLDVTYYKRSVSFVYMAYADDGTTLSERGAWFQLKGVRLTGDPNVQNVKLTVQCETVVETSSGFGPGTESGEITDVRFTKSSNRPWTPTPHPTHTRQQPSRTSATRPNPHATHKPQITSSTSVTPPIQDRPPKPSGQQDNFIGVVVGVSVGGLVALALFAVAVFLCLRRRSLNDTPDMETKGTITPSRPTLPPRNPGMKRSMKAGDGSIPEYFEPVDDNVYCIPEEVAKEAADYAVLEGTDNPQYLEPVVNRSPNNAQQTSTAIYHPTYEGEIPVEDEFSSDYDNAEPVPDYENTRVPLENKSSGGYNCNVPEPTDSSEVGSKTRLENKNSGGYCGLVDQGVSNATDTVYQPLGS